MANDDLIDQLMSLDGPALRSALSGALGSLSMNTGKGTKAEANYRKADDNDSGERSNSTRTRGEPAASKEPDRPRECGGCVHFAKSAGTVDGGCTEVAGTIFHEYVCDWFDADPTTNDGPGSDDSDDDGDTDTGASGDDDNDSEGGTQDY